MPHWRRQYDSPRWVENGTQVIIGTIAVAAYAALVIGGITLIFLTVPKAKAAPACQQGQIAGLAELANDLGVKPASNPNMTSGIGCDGKVYDIVEIVRAHVAMMRKVRK